MKLFRGFVMDEVDHSKLRSHYVVAGGPCTARAQFFEKFGDRFVKTSVARVFPELSVFKSSVGIERLRLVLSDSGYTELQIESLCGLLSLLEIESA